MHGALCFLRSATRESFYPEILNFQSVHCNEVPLPGLQQGGALFQNNTFVSIFSSTFNSSSAYVGGALALINPKFGTINQTNFVFNNASQVCVH